ncbi:MAG: cytochrome c [Desulfuromonadales bacterium]|nr:cytochrome c [Desulfuromonadales bacterium]
MSYPVRSAPEKINTSVGKELFHAKCASCHGKPSEGRSERAAFFEPPAPDFTAPMYQQIDPAYLFWRIETGKDAEPFRSQGSVMPAWGSHFDEEQIWRIVAYLRSRSA